MRQGTGYAYDGGEDCISYKCEGCGRRVRVTPIQARHFRGAFTACSKICVLKARAIRTQQGRLDRDVPGPSTGAAGARALRLADGAAPEREGACDKAQELTTP
jgi:hypothetical protein